MSKCKIFWRAMMCSRDGESCKSCKNHVNPVQYFHRIYKIHMIYMMSISGGNMDNTKYYLKQNVQFEPLFNQWYAWTHLIAPHTAAMFIANLHLKIMKSYVAAPQVHANAVRNPAMLGGPFINYDGGKVDQIKALIEKTT